MVKNILKELIIILLLTLAIILLLGVLLYDYVPMNKVIPEKITYAASEEVKQISTELNEKKEDIPITSYTVTSTDLKNYKKVNDYTAGRKNPFATVGTTGGTTGTGSTTENKNSENTTTGNTTGSGTTNGGNTNENSTNYYPDRGTK